MVLIALAALGYSLFSIFAKIALNHGASTSDLFAWRFLLALPAIWLVAATAGQARSRQVPRLAMLGAGLVFAGVAGSAFAAVERLPASLYIVVIYTYPSMVTIVGLFRGERPSPRTWTALALATCGVILTVPDLLDGFGAIDGIGLLLTLLNAALYAVYILVTGRVLRGVDDQFAGAAWSITGSALVAVVLVASGKVHAPPDTRGFWALVGLALVATVLSGAAFLAGMRRLGPTRASILSTVEPVLGVIWAVTILGEHLQPLQILGAAAVLGSVLVLQGRGRAAPPRRAAGSQPSSISA